MLNLTRRNDIEAENDAPAYYTGWLLLVTAIATLAAESARVVAGADLPTLTEALAAIARNRALYGFGGAARLLSGFTLFAGACFLWHTRFMRRRFGTLLITLLLAASGLFTAASGLCAVALAQISPHLPPAPSAPLLAELRWISGKIGFTLAGLALLATSLRQWRVGGLLRRLAPVSAFVGLAMQLIWVPAASLLHRFTGPLFVFWLALIGFMLASGRVQRRILGNATPPKQ